MSWLDELTGGLELPVLCAPMFIVSQPALVFAQCVSGVIGAFPALNARPQPMLDTWLQTLEADLAAYRAAHPGAKVAPYAVNQIVHKTNERLEADFDTIERHRVPFVITSLRAPGDYVQRIHRWGGRVFHDVVNRRHAEKALEAGVDGLILVCAGAGGHAGLLNPLAFVAEIRRFYDGPIVLSGAISQGRHILAARAMGADLAYMGTRFIATDEANAPDGYKRMIVQSGAGDVVYTPYFSGTPGSYLRGSVTAAGFDPDRLPDQNRQMAFTDHAGDPGTGAKAWKDVWSAGQGVAGIGDILPVGSLVARLRREYDEARARL